jgi:hypothetical protein
MKGPTNERAIIPKTIFQFTSRSTIMDDVEVPDVDTNQILKIWRGYKIVYRLRM